MIDLHTHILCGVDDGARTVDESLQLLRMERDSGVSAVVLTPHFYRDRARPEHFFAARQKAMDALLAHLDTLEEAERVSLPRLIPAAEVAWRPNMARWEELEKFCIPGTRNLLLELPFVPWERDLCNELYSLMNRTGITPVLAHVERYLASQDIMQVAEIISLGLPAQITASEFLRLSTRRKALKALNLWAHVIATDCHNTDSRKPCMGQAMDVVAKKLGRGTADRLCAMAETLVG